MGDTIGATDAMRATDAPRSTNGHALDCKGSNADRWLRVRDMLSLLVSIDVANASSHDAMKTGFDATFHCTMVSQWMQYQRIDRNHRAMSAASRVVFHGAMSTDIRAKAMYAQFAKHPYGRIVLHVIAMLGDGQVRWHCAGIARELTALQPAVAHARAQRPQDHR